MTWLKYLKNFNIEYTKNISKSALRVYTLFTGRAGAPAPRVRQGCRRPLAPSAPSLALLVSLPSRGRFSPYRASISFRVWEGGLSLISAADRGVVLLGDTGRPPSVEMSGGGALSAAVGGVLLRSPFWCPAVGLIRG